MKTLLIYTHHYDKSLNAGILERITKSYDKTRKEYVVINLVKDKFNPDFSEEELHLFHEGKSIDPLVKKYQDILLEVNEVIMIYPIWWSEMPALLKGFFDKVMLNNHAYHYDSRGNLVGNYTHIKKVTAITTMATPHEYFINHCGNAVQKVHLDTIWRQLGAQDTDWINFDQAILYNEEKRLAKLNELEEMVKQGKL